MLDFIEIMTKQTHKKHYYYAWDCGKNV